MKYYMILALTSSISLRVIASPGLSPVPVDSGGSVAAGACTDLTGVWIGSCTKEDGTQYQDAVRVAQDGCKSVQFGFATFISGGTFRAGAAWPGAGDIEEVLMFDWSPTGDKLTYKKAGSGRSLGGSRSTVEGFGYLALDHGDLVLVADQLTTTDSQVKQYKLSCRYQH